jgi:hypothetical protein
MAATARNRLRKLDRNHARQLQKSTPVQRPAKLFGLLGIESVVLARLQVQYNGHPIVEALA